MKNTDPEAYMMSLLEYAVEHVATDVHLCPGSRPLVRVNSKLQHVPDTEVLLPQSVNALIPVILDPSKMKQLEEYKALDFSFARSGLGRFRANIYSQRGTYAAAIRALPVEVPSFEELGLPTVVEQFAHKQKGLFLVTGATGSGKSTTLASLVDTINTNYPYHILTIEDPVEYIHKHKMSLITQREIGQDCDSFAVALRSALREDPDVIMVGEMRDPETISIALTAAETGHLVISTIHTVGTSKSIDRILDAFSPNQQAQVRSQLATVLEGIISQQLIQRKDGKGLVAATEVMVVTPAIRNLIREGKHYQINSVIQTGQSHGMQLLDADLARLCKENIIDKQEALMRCSDPQVFEQFLNRS